jgi:hypothetical protein
MRYAIPTFFLLCQLAQAQELVPIAFERWDAAFLGDARAGYVHTAVTKQPGDMLLGTVELRLQVKRINETVQLGMDNGTFETADGVVTDMFMKQFLGKTQSLDIQGKVDGNKLLLTLNKTKRLDPAPWTDRVVGIAKQQQLFRDHKVKPGDQFHYLSFEPSINLVVTTRVHVGDYEIVEMPGGQGKAKLLRADVKADRIQTFQPPAMTVWLNDDLEAVRSETEVPGLGKMTLVKTTKQHALAPVIAMAKSVEAQRIVPLKQRLPRPHDMTAAIYRIRVKGDTDPASGFSTDGRQRPGNVQGDTFDLTVRRGIVAQAEKIGPEYLQSSHFINSADAKVRELARRAVGIEADPWKKALKIERYVADAMRPNAHELLATADHVARTLEGDCTEYAMLTTAMCRAEGVPSRTAIGLVYGDVRGQPAFIFHMWTEVWVRGQWVGLDATLGRGGIGAAHLKVADQSWHNESSMTPLLSTLNLLGRVSIDVLRTE